MNKYFKSFKEYEIYINKKLTLIMKQLMKECKQQLMDSVETNLYTMYPNSKYNNTMQFLNAVDTTFTVFKGVITIECYINPDKMTTGIDYDSGWGIHQDIYGDDVREHLVGWLEFGTTGGIFPREGAKFIESVLDYYKLNYKKILKERLKIMGIKTTIV